MCLNVQDVHIYIYIYCINLNNIYIYIDKDKNMYVQISSSWHTQLKSCLIHSWWSRHIAGWVILLSLCIISDMPLPKLHSAVRNGKKGLFGALCESMIL